MAERSAQDREGVGSNPASGSHTANPGYAAFRLAKALTTAEQHHDPETRERARQKAEKWASIFAQMLDGWLRVGSRAPLDNVPIWATPEVVTGGFATGNLLAGGPLRKHETSLAAEIGVAVDAENRVALNQFFMTDEGLSRLLRHLNTGAYEIGVPEEAALLVVAWLLSQAKSNRARELIDQIAPFFPRLRFYPAPAEHPQRLGSRVFLQDVNATIESLRAIGPNPLIAAQKEAIEVWTPLYDEIVSLFLETVEGPAPHLAVGDDGARLPRVNGRFLVNGGWPCKAYPENWHQRAADCAQRFELQRREFSCSSKPRHRKSSLAQLAPYLSRCVADSASLSGRDVGTIRLLLARYVAKRGLPDSVQCRSVRAHQARQGQTPMFHRVAAVAASRLEPYPGKEGVEDIAPVIKSVSEEEAALCGLAAGHALPDTIRRKIERCMWESIQELVERGLITSGETLAQVLPQVTSELQAAGIVDPSLRRLYSAIYRAFRRRRSLLLLDLESQVKIGELPWVAAIEQFRSDSLSGQELARQTLEEIVSLALVSFPHAILPNKLLQELRNLANAAKLDMPLTDELAADIFMGAFSDKFVHAAKKVGRLMHGTLYQAYYGIDYEAIERLGAIDNKQRRKLAFRSAPMLDEFAALCCARAGVEYSGWHPATNGMIIEQQQVVTTQNLAVLFDGLGLAETLRPYLSGMAHQCFDWVCRRLQLKQTDWHARLISVKNAAYAWRQMLFYLSFVDAAELHDFCAWIGNHMSEQSDGFRVRFRPAVAGLLAAGQDVCRSRFDMAMDHKIQFLGWSKSRHWLLE